MLAASNRASKYMTVQDAFARAAAILLSTESPMSTREHRPKLIEALQIVWPHLREAATRFGEIRDLRDLRRRVSHGTTIEEVVKEMPPGRLGRISVHIALVAQRLRRKPPRGRRGANRP